MVNSDARNKEVALSRIRRLSSSGLPLEPFVRSVFELINDAVPYSANRSVLVGGSNDRDTLMGSTEETLTAFPLFREYFIDKPEISGPKFRQDSRTLRRILPSKVIWAHEELASSDYLRAEGFNAVMRPLGWHHLVQVIFQENGQFIGHAPIWRSADQKSYGREDIEFLRAIAPHIAHGIRAAQLLARETSAEADNFVPLQGWGSGVILMDHAGKPIAIDTTARLIFQQLGEFDGLRGDAFASRPVRVALDYVTHSLQRIFHEAGGLPTAVAPVCAIHLHWTGIALRVRGIMLAQADGREYITVLVERGETLESRRNRLRIRWGLSHRENEVLSLAAEGKTGPEISILLRISHDTTRKHMSRIFERLGVENRTAAAAMLLSGDLA